VLDEPLVLEVVLDVGDARDVAQLSDARLDEHELLGEQVGIGQERGTLSRRCLR
jgi:hypothetical protein